MAVVAVHRTRFRYESSWTCPKIVSIGAPAQEFPPVFFFSKKSGGKALLQNLENLGGDMARPRIKNLASPISDFAPPQRQSDSPPKSSRPWEDIQPLA